jgi:citrate lyase beta subunit
MTSKQETQKQRKNWREAIRDGRVVKYFDGHMVAHATYEEAERAIVDSDFEAPAYRVPSNLSGL